MSVPFLRKRQSIIPGFGLTMGFTLAYLGLVVLIPLSTLYLKTASMDGQALWHTITSQRAIAAYKLSFGASAVAACINTVCGLLVAWVLVRYYFPGKALVDALVDLPFALPTAVAGISLTSIYSAQGWVGRLFAPFDMKIAYTRVGITIALTFIGLPFVVRTLQPVLRDLDPEVEEAASSLGATRWQTFVRVLVPTVLPATLTGFALAFARALGEYGSVVFIAGNMPLRTEIAPLLIMTRLEEYDYKGATALAVFMLSVSFLLLFGINMLQRWSRRHQEVGG
ncbi:MAG TPA: sulfate ABC transporter permease subunit CysT [Candidatus Hydrogenedentes bacterium]|nr:sulfate ABC transporter permease subunit CysT [Candidatus Hydrogenedentota bacterium]HPG70359.1 sulfate ABC transporter permease subunit CysT [Candidatus Hydrogenedentota bacterium]